MTAKPSYEELERRIQELQKTESELKQIKGVLLESEEGYRTLIQFSPLPFLVTQEERIIVVNPAALNFFGIKDEGEIIGTSPGRWIHPDFIDLSYQRRCQVLENGGLAEIKELILIRKDAQEKIVLANTVRITHNGSPATLSVFQDITELKKTQDKLTESEALFRGMFNNHSAVMLLIDPNTGRIIMANQSATQYYGYSLEKMLQMKIHQLNMSSSAEIEKEMESAFNKQINIFEFQHLMADGQARDVEVHSAPITIQNQTLLFSIIRDITERKWAEVALRESEALLDTTGFIARVGGWQLDVETMAVTWTKETYNIHEVPLNDKPPLEKAIEFFHPDDRGTLSQAIQRALDLGEPYDMDLRFITAKGKNLWTRTTCQPEVLGGKTVRLRGTFQDITVRKRVEEELQRKEKDLRESQRIAHVGSWRLHVATNQVIWTEELYNIYGFDSSLPPPPYTEHMKLFTPESWERLSTALAHTRETGIPYTLELETVRKDGSNGWMWVHGEADVDSAGKTVELWGAAQDITERKRTEETLRKSEERFLLAMKASNDGLFDWNLETNDIYYSPAWKNLLGYEDHELPNDFSIWEKTTDPEDVKKSWEFQQKLISKQIDRFVLEFKMKHKDGHWIDILARAEAIFNDSGKAVRIVGTHVDITERKRVEKALIEKEALFRELFDHMTSGSAVYEVRNDGSKGKDYIIRGFNRKSLEIEGKTLDEVIGRSLFDLRPNIDDYGLIPVMKKVWETGNPLYYPTKIYQDDRFSNYYENHIFKLPSGEIVTIYNDVTDEKNQEKDLQESERKYRVLFDTFPLGITVSDQSGKIVESNAMSEKLLGIAKTEHETRTIDEPKWQIIRADGTSMPAAEYASVRALKGKRIVENVEMGVVKSDTEITWINVSAAPLYLEKYGVVVTYGDITERKRVEEALREQLDFSESLIETAQTVILVLDPQGRIVRFNPYMEELVGYGLDEVKGKDWFETFIKSENCNTVKSVFQKAVGDIQTRGNVNPIIAKDGRTILVEWYDKTLKDKYGRTMGILAIGYDITERKQAETERENLQAQLLQAQKMESVGRLAGGVAHDFNNMLGVILGHAELALERAEENHDICSDLKEIQTAAQRSADLTKQLLTFARKQIIEPKLLNLNQTVKQMITMLQRLIGEDIHLIWKPCEALWPVKMDPSQIDQILANLCVNARDAIAGVGKLTIETGMVSFDEAYCNDHAGFIPGDFVLLGVSDNGSGMDKKTLSNLFEPFFTTKEMGKGTGLGLATVYGIVKQNKGFINVYSEPGQGSTFKIYLPRHTAIDPTAPVIHTEQQDPGGNETILLVEDEPAILNMVRMMLERKGYSVLSAATPAEAIALAKIHADKIHLLMTDVVMPEMNGRDLARHLIAVYPDVKLLFMSGYTANVIAHQGVLDEGVSFIQKPFSRADLLVKLRSVLDEATGRPQIKTY